MASRKLTILDLRDSPWVDGPGRTTLETAMRIDREWYRIIVAGFTGGAQKTDEYLKDAERRGLPVVRLEESGPFDPSVIRQVLQLIDRNQVDIVHTHEFRSNAIGLICARLRRIPVVATCHGWIANNAKGRLRVLLDRLVLYFFDHIIVVSRKLQSQLHRQGIGLKRMTALPNAVAFENFARRRDGMDLREELNVPADTVLVANIGRLSPEKGQAEFINAAAGVARIHPNIRFLLIGVGPDREQLELQVRDNGFPDHFVFCGYRSDMSRIYSNLDLVVQSSFTEGMPNVILESAAMEVPVIATDVGGTAEIIEHEVSGILVQPGIPRAIEAAMLEFLQNREKYRGLARAARLSVEKQFSYASRTAQMMKIYDGVALKS